MTTATITLIMDTSPNGDTTMHLNETGPKGARGALLTGLIERNAEFKELVLAALATYFARNPSTAPPDLVALLVTSGISGFHYEKK